MTPVCFQTIRASVYQAKGPSGRKYVFLSDRPTPVADERDVERFRGMKDVLREWTPRSAAPSPAGKLRPIAYRKLGDHSEQLRQRLAAQEGTKQTPEEAKPEPEQEEPVVERFICPECGKECGSALGLRSHVRKHRSENPEKSKGEPIEKDGEPKQEEESEE